MVQQTSEPGFLSDPLEGLRSALFTSRLYRFILAREVPDNLLQSLNDPWPGDAARGDAISEGRWHLANQTFVFDHRLGPPDWYPPGAWEGWLEELHGFTWLRDLQEAGGHARPIAQTALAGWLSACGSWNRFAWRPDILGRRLAAWLTHHGFLVGDADPRFRKQFFRSLAEQTRHLARVAGRGPPGLGRIAVLRALIFAGIALPGSARRLPQVMRLLKHELDHQMLPDGGQRERNPSIQYLMLRDLADIRLALIQGRHPVPGWLQQTIDRAAPMLRFYRHGDGGLALFNGSREESPHLVDNVLAIGQATGRPLRRTPYTGFERLEAGNTVVLVDAAWPPAADWTARAHAAPLAFEMSHGRERLIVSMGSWHGPNSDWQQAARETAAHSTITVDDRSLAEFRRDGCLGRGPHDVRVERREQHGRATLVMSHDGYHATLRVIHHRTLTLSADGHVLSGEEVLDGPGGERFSLRFHLHPDVRAAIMHDSQSVLLGQKSGKGWRLSARGGILELMGTVYLGSHPMRTSQQVVVSGGLNGVRNVITWELERIESRSRRKRKPSHSDELALV